MFTDVDEMLPVEICPKEQLSIPFQSLGTYYIDNQFELWMSDEFGDFSNAILLQSLQQQVSGNFNVQIPNLVDGGDYKFRVDATSPPVMGSETNATNILSTPNSNFTYQVGVNDVYFTDITTSSNSWSWDFDDGNSSVLQHPDHLFATSGMYNVSLATSNGICEDTVFHQILIEEVTLIQINDNPNFKVFPNPSSGIFNVQVDNVVGRMSISNSEGKIILSKKIDSNGLISLELASGVYWISIYNSNEELVGTEKIVRL